MNHQQRRIHERTKRLLVRATKLNRPFLICDVGEGTDYPPAQRLLRELYLEGALRRTEVGGMVVYEWIDP